MAIGSWPVLYSSHLLLGPFFLTFGFRWIVATFSSRLLLVSVLNRMPDQHYFQGTCKVINEKNDMHYIFRFIWIFIDLLFRKFYNSPETTGLFAKLESLPDELKVGKSFISGLQLVQNIIKLSRLYTCEKFILLRRVGQKIKMLILALSIRILALKTVTAQYIQLSLLIHQPIFREISH